MAKLCNYDDNLYRVEITDPKGYMDPVTVGYVQEYNVEEEFEVSEEYTFDGVVVDTFKHPKTTISMTRLIRYNVEDEVKIQNLIYCMRTDPMNITFTAQRTSPDFTKNPVGVLTETYKNCRISSNKRDFKPDEAFKQELEFKSEGRLLGTEYNTWAWLEE